MLIPDGGTLDSICYVARVGSDGARLGNPDSTPIEGIADHWIPESEMASRPGWLSVCAPRSRAELYCGPPLASIPLFSVRAIREIEGHLGRLRAVLPSTPDAELEDMIERQWSGDADDIPAEAANIIDQIWRAKDNGRSA